MNTSLTRLSATLTLSVAAMGAAVIFAPNAAAEAPAATAAVTQTAAETSVSEGTLTKRSKKLKGSFEIIERGGQTYLRLNDDFRASNGPDLKVFLSPTNLETVTGKTAVNGAINLGELKKTKGSQEYLIPAGTNLETFQSVLIHCEAYAVLWGGSDIYS